MPRNIQAQINRNRYNQAVSVYSPTRTLRPPGRTANAGTANQILGGGQPQQYGDTMTGQLSFGQPPAGQLPGWQPATGTPGAMRTGSLLEQMATAPTGTPPQPGAPGGLKGLLGTVVNNPVGRGLITALEPLNYPRRIIQSSINEVADAFNGGDFSFDDWTHQIGDREFSFSKMVGETGNSILDGIIGFAGDVALDPLTYVGGAGLYSGISGRTARAGTAAAAEALGVKVGELSAEQTARMIGRWGFSRFDDVARAELRDQLPGMAANILDRGYHFKVPLGQRFFGMSDPFVRIPGTGLIDRAVGQTFAGARDLLSRSPLGGWMRYATNPNGMRDAVTTLVTRSPQNGLTFARAAEIVNFNNGRKIAEKTFMSRAGKMADEVIVAAGGGAKGRAALNDLYQRAEAEGGTSLHEYFAAIRKLAVDEYGVHIPEFEGAYLPHFWTTEGQAWRKGDTAAAKEYQGYFKDINLDDPAAVALFRPLRAGETFAKQKLVSGTADEINKIGRNTLGLEYDLIETDFHRAAHQYIRSLKDNVGTVGGVRKVLGSKSGLLRSMDDGSFADLISEEDIRSFASRDVADRLVNQHRQATTVVRNMRKDSQRGVTEIGGSFGVELREGLTELKSVVPAQRKKLDDLVAQQIALEEQLGVGKYGERFRSLVRGKATAAVAPIEAGRGTLQREFDKTYNALAQQFRTAEQRLVKLEADAAVEARRLEAAGGVGATPAADALARAQAMQGQTTADMAAIEAIQQRLDVNRAAQGAIDARLGERDFANLSVADDLSPKSPGAAPVSAAVAAPAYSGPAPLQVATDFQARRSTILGAADPQVAVVAARYEAQARVVDRAQRRMWEARVNDTAAIDTAHRAMVDSRRYEAGLKHAVEHTRGKPGELENHLEFSQRLDDLQAGEIPRRQAEYAATRRNLDDAENLHRVESQRLAEIRDEQMALARSMDARRGDAPSPPLTRTQEATLRSQRTRLTRDRGKWLRSPEGVAHAKAQRQLDTLTGRLEEVGAQVERATGSGGRFFVDADGAVQPKFTTNEPWARRLIDERDGTLVPARDAAKGRLDGARETWERLSAGDVEGARAEVNRVMDEIEAVRAQQTRTVKGSPERRALLDREKELIQQHQRANDVAMGTSTELLAAKREVAEAQKAWRKAQDAVDGANQRLTAVDDTPNLGGVGPDADELRRLLKVQASMKVRADELANEIHTSGEQLRSLDQGIGGIDSQLAAQTRAKELLAQGPATPYGAQIAALNRGEQQALDGIESSFNQFRRDWDEPVELPAAPSDLGRFEGQWENSPTIKAALDVLARPDGRLRTFTAMDEATGLANSAAAVRAAGQPFTVPPRGTPAHAAVMNYSPASRGGAMGAVGRSQTVAAETQHLLETHADELVTSGAIPQEFADDLFRRRLEVDRALDLHASNPTQHVRADLEQQASELGRLTGFALRYKTALEGGNEASDGLASFLLARHLDEEAATLRAQIDIGNTRLATAEGAAGELDHAGNLAELNAQAALRRHQIESEVAKGRAGGPWSEQNVKRWTSELDGLQRRIDRIGPPANGSLDDAIDSHAAYAAGDMRDLDDAVAIYDERRFVDHRMQYPVRRRDELAAAIPHREAEVLAAGQTQKRLEEGVRLARRNGSSTVRYTPYDTRGFRRPVVTLPLEQAEANLAANARVIDMLEHDLVNKQVQQSLLEGTAQHRLTLLERELGDADMPPVPADLAAESAAIQREAAEAQRALTPGELETIASNQARIERLNQGGLPPRVQRAMSDEADILRKAVDDFERVAGGDPLQTAVARDGGDSLIRTLVGGGTGPISPRAAAMLKDVVGPETAAAATVWIHFLDEVFAGRAAVSADELSGIVDDAARTFGDVELVDRMRQRAAAATQPDGTVALDEMRDELATALLASANRQRGEAIRETTSMQALFGSSFVDGPGGLRPRFGDAVADEPSHQLLTARLRSETVAAMKAKGYDPRNAVVDQVADLRTRLGTVETMRRGIEGNEEWADVLLTGTPSVQARRTLQAGKAELQAEEQALLAQVDAPRAARLADQQHQLTQRTAAERDEITSEMSSLQRQADIAEHLHTERMEQAGLELATVRQRVGEAFHDYRSFTTLRDQIANVVRNKPTRKTESLRRLVADMDGVNQWRREAGSVDEADIAAVEANLVAQAEALDRLDAAATDAATLDARVKALAAGDARVARVEAALADPKQVAEVTSGLISDAWRVMARGLIEDSPEGVLIDDALYKAITNVQRYTTDNKFWKFLDRYTAFFKTYATSKPGFHLRNAMSATFMNMVDGVRLRDMWQGARLWRQYEKDPTFWMRADPQIRDAFHAVFASGAGGHYAEPGLYTDILQSGGGRMYRRVMDNALTRWNQRLGSRVEGSARLAMALNSVYRGANVEQGMRRIAKFHFDYTEMSDLDHMARRLIPFWTFMSRNLPLQLEQMFTNPRMYLQYQNLKRNFQQQADPLTPGYWLSAGAFTVDQHAADRESPWYIAPDLPHLQVTEPLDALIRGDVGKAMLSDINPLLRAPVEVGMMGHEAFSGRSLEGYEETSRLNPFTPMFNLIAAATPFEATARAGSGQTVIDKRAADVARSLLPPWEFAERLLDPTGKRAGRTDETIYRALGVPVRQLTPELREQEQRSAYYERREAVDRQADLARM